MTSIAATVAKLKCDTCGATGPEMDCGHWYEVHRRSPDSTSFERHYCCPAHVPNLIEEQWIQKQTDSASSEPLTDAEFQAFKGGAGLDEIRPADDHPMAGLEAPDLSPAETRKAVSTGSAGRVDRVRRLTGWGCGNRDCDYCYMDEPTDDKRAGIPARVGASADDSERMTDEAQANSDTRHESGGPVMPASDAGDTSEFDPAIVPLVKALWTKGVQTYQSCSGHADAESYPSAHIWVERGALTDAEAQKLSEHASIESVSLLFGREQLFAVWEIVFEGETKPFFADACAAIIDTLSTSSHGTSADLKEARDLVDVLAAAIEKFRTHGACNYPHCVWCESLQAYQDRSWRGISSNSGNA